MDVDEEKGDKTSPNSRNADTIRDGDGVVGGDEDEDEGLCDSTLRCIKLRF